MGEGGDMHEREDICAEMGQAEGGEGRGRGMGEGKWQREGEGDGRGEGGKYYRLHRNRGRALVWTCALISCLEQRRVDLSGGFGAC